MASTEVIYILEDSQRHEAELVIARFAIESGKAVHTSLSHLVFQGVGGGYQNYYRNDPNRPLLPSLYRSQTDFIRQHLQRSRPRRANLATRTLFESSRRFDQVSTTRQSTCRVVLLVLGVEVKRSYQVLRGQSDSGPIRLQR